MFPKEKYRYYTDNKGKVVAVSSYAGRPVRGIAKCNPNDEFNLEFGKELAAARCNGKIARKRSERAYKLYTDALAAAYRATRHSEKMEKYLIDAENTEEAADKIVEKLLQR